MHCFTFIICQLNPHSSSFPSLSNLIFSYVRDPNTETLTLEVHDKDMNNNKLIGKIVLYLNELLANVGTKKGKNWYSLVRPAADGTDQVR